MRNEVKSLFTQYWQYLTVYTACKLNIFDTLYDQDLTLAEICAKCHLIENRAAYLLQALSCMGYLHCSEERYRLTSQSEFLSEQHPKSLKYACLHWASETMNAWQHLDLAMQEETSSFEKLYHCGIFQYIEQNEQKLDEYHKAMNEYAQDDYQNLPSIIDFSLYQSVLDCGGGYGAAISQIKKTYPSITCGLFDRPEVVKRAHTQGIKRISGDFFEGIPTGYEVILLSRIIHDWEDTKAQTILRNCYLSLPPKGTLLIIENCTEKIEDISFLALNMFAVCNSYERTSSEYIKLAESEGFTFKEHKQLNDLQTVLIFTK